MIVSTRKNTDIEYEYILHQDSLFFKIYSAIGLVLCFVRIHNAKRFLSA